MHPLVLVFVLSCGVTLAAPALAQKLPPTSRNVFKCEVEGKVVYSDEPCLGAQRVDVEPTRGVNKLSGTKRVGRDMRDEQFNEAMADAMHPLLGETPQQRATRHRRARLGPDVRARCAALDRQLPVVENDERRAASADLAAAQRKLLALRKEYQTLRC